MRLPERNGVGDLLLAALGGVVAIVVVVVVGVHDQHDRRISDVTSVSIAIRGRPTVAMLSWGPARRLAAQVNDLPREPSYGGCDQVLVQPWVLPFDSPHGAIRVYLERLGCPYVSIVSGGQNWDAETWDAYGRLRRAIKHDLADARH